MSTITVRAARPAEFPHVGELTVAAYAAIDPDLGEYDPPVSSRATASAPTYRPGACNIGPAEIAARRLSGHAGVAATLTLLAFLLVSDAPRGWRALLFVPASGAAAGYLQAASRFCIGFAWRGVFNLGDTLGQTVSVADGEARRRDRREALRLAAAAGAIGAAVAAVAIRL